MVTTGLCASCGGRVALNDDDSCIYDHPASQVRDIARRDDSATDSADTPGPTWAVGVDGVEPRGVHRSAAGLVGALLLAATVVTVLVAALLGNASEGRLAPAGASLIPVAAIAATAPASTANTDSAIPPSRSTLGTVKGSEHIDMKSAMAPTIVSGQRYTLRRGGSAPRVGDIVYFRAENGSRLIRRVVGVGGDSISINEGWVYRDGAGPGEPYVRYNDTRISVGAILVPKGAVLVIGDNRDQLSHQFWGLVKVTRILGRVTP